MVNNQLKIYIKKGLSGYEKKHISKKKTGSQSGFVGSPKSTEFCQVFIYPGFLAYFDQSSHQVDRVPGRPAGPV